MSSWKQTMLTRFSNPRIHRSVEDETDTPGPEPRLGLGVETDFQDRVHHWMHGCDLAWSQRGESFKKKNTKKYDNMQNIEETHWRIWILYWKHRIGEYWAKLESNFYSDFIASTHVFVLPRAFDNFAKAFALPLGPGWLGLSHEVLVHILSHASFIACSVRQLE